ncbi:MAG: peptidylprolyl isomerase [Cryomorphaceae bacterium]|nr:peptidylprolyl isomerase [Cryomorphaceae bacterium]
MKKIGLSILCGAFALVISAQNVLTIDSQNISLEEFKNVFYKNNNNTELTKKYLDEYMQLFVNFKLKVKEADELGLDTITAFLSELDGYRIQLAKPYLKNKEFDENMLTEAYDRMKQDIKASHILISVDEKATAQQEKEAYDKALAVRSSILANTISFAAAAQKNSDDKSALTNDGNLSYFTAFMMVYDFESAAYSTEIGEISLPIRTKYGYHIIKVTDKREASGEVKVAHIMFKSGQGSDDKKLNEAKDKINKVSELLKNGEKFSDVAERFSEDRSTAVKGGSLPAFGVGKMVPEFETVAFELKEIGDVSAPFRTEYGWHIITLLERKGIPKFEDIKVELKRKIESDSRGELSKQALFAKLHTTYKVESNPKVYTAFRMKASNTITTGTFSSSSKNNTRLVTINGKAIAVSSFVNYILLNQKAGSDFDELYTAFVNQELLAYEESQLETKYPEYKALLQEYREGILLFDLTNTKVWTKAVEDTVGLQNFFTANNSNYRWENRVDASVYSCIDLATAIRVKRAIYKKHRGNITDAEILTETNTDAPLSLQINTKKFVKGENEYVDAVDWELGIAADIKTSDGSYIIVDIHEVLASGLKELNETRGKVISDYQNTLELEWIASLQEKYKVSINNEVLYTLIKQ